MYEAECQTLLSSFQDLKKLEPKQKAHDRLLHEETAAEPDQDVETELKRFPVLAAYDLCLKCSHLFNLLDARGAISVTERVGVIARIRNLAVGVAKAYAAQQHSKESQKN